MLLWPLGMRALAIPHDVAPTGFEILKKWVRDRFAHVLEGPEYVLFDLEGVRMRVVHLAAEDWVALAGVICDGDRIAHGEALAYNRYGARVGALAIENGRYQLRQLLPRTMLDEAGFQRIVLALAREVLRLARSVCPERRTFGDLFAPYSD